MKLTYQWPLPIQPRPIAIIGAGGIVNDAHLPAYRKGGFRVLGIFDIQQEQSAKTARIWNLKAFETLETLISITQAQNGVYDLALPPYAISQVLEELPDHANVLIQKPMGSDLQEAKAIRTICDRKQLTAAVNFQLRFSPMMLALRDAMSKGLLGKILDLEVHLNLETHWELFPFLKKMERVEIAVHSIHYLDLIRSFLGTPSSVWAQTLGHPSNPDFKQTRTSAILNYGPEIRCLMSINHNYTKGPRFQSAQIKFDCQKSAALVKLGLLLDYPLGEPDEVWIYPSGEEQWKSIEFEGGWFPEAFIGTMSNLQRFTSGEDNQLFTSITDAFETMKVVEACYTSSKSGGTDV
jgi:predicted dehydrogenase